MINSDELNLLKEASARASVLINERLVLYAGASLPSVAAQQAYSVGLSAYPAMGPSFAKEQPETELVSRLEMALRERVCDLLGARWVEPRLGSCTLANLAVFNALASPGDLLLAPSAAHGGHLSQRRGGTPSLAGLTVEDLPFDTQRCCLDAERAAEHVMARRPNLIMLGRSVMIRPDDIAPVIDAAKSVGAKTIFDASHVIGLIAGGTFPNPLTLGVDVLTSSTYKTLPGRPHGLIAGMNPQDEQRVCAVVEGALSANYDAGKLSSLLVTLRESSVNGQDYARRVCVATRSLANSLRQAGVAVLAPEDSETFTHQLLIPMSPDIKAADAVASLEKHGILVGTCADPTTSGGYALRVGTQFLTAQGQDDQLECVARRLVAALMTTDDGRMTVV